MDTNTILVIIVSLLTLALMYTIFAKVRLHYHIKKQQHSNKIIAMEIIDLAIVQGSNFTIGAIHAELQDRNIVGYCYKMNINSLYISINDAVRPLSFIDEDIRVYFSVLYKRRPVYYQFTSHVNDILSIDGSYVLSISAPDRLDSGQKRTFIRITPRRDAVIAISVWLDSTNGFLPTSIDTISQANFNYRPQYIEEIILENISAGGMLLLADIDVCKENDTKFKKDEQLLIFLVLRSDQNQKPVSFWLAGNVILTKTNPMHTKQLIVNVAISKWAILENNNTINWFSIGKNGGAPPLANWVLRHHLEQNRLT